MNYLLYIIILIFGGIIGYLIGQNRKTKNDTAWKAKFQETEKELKSSLKETKRSRKTINQLEQQKEALELKHREVEEKYQPQVQTLKSELKTTTETFKNVKIEKEKMTTAHDRIKSQYEGIQKKHEQLKETYAKDMADSKGWKNKRDTYERTIASLEAKVLKEQKEIQSLRERLTEQQGKISEASKFAKDFRIQKANNRKLTKDLKYWEQKHFDTHHELTAAKEEIEKLTKAKEDMHLRFKGAEIEKENMMEKIVEFKTKFVNINNLYHELKSNN